MGKISCYLFKNLPDANWSEWTLAVFATSKQDARNYIKAHHQKGKFIGEIKSGKVQANCGAVTENASIANRRTK
jgi:hypothetical protein